MPRISTMNLLSATLILLILGAGLALYFGVKWDAAASLSAPVIEILASA